MRFVFIQLLKVRNKNITRSALACHGRALDFDLKYLNLTFFWRLPCKVADGALESFSFFHHLSFSCPAHGSMGGAQRNEESYVTRSDTCKHKSSLDSDGK